MPTRADGDVISAATLTGWVPDSQPPPPQTASACSSYLPNDSSLNRFLYTVRFFAQQGVYVLVDNHLAVEDPLPG